jgi:enterochelin esterase-like enzyme
VVAVAGRRRWIVFALTIAFVGLIGWCAVPARAPGGRPVSEGAAALEPTVRAIEAGSVTTPIVEQRPGDALPTMTFYAKRDGTEVPRVVSDVTGWGERADGTFDFNTGRMTRVGMTDWYSLATVIEPDARIEYLIAHGPSAYRLDPHNPRRVTRVAGPASEVVGPRYVFPQEFADPPTDPAGAITDTFLPSKAIGSPRRVIIYTPPGYRTDRTYPLAVFHDGDLVVNTGHAPRVIDWLIAHRLIEPIVVVFVEPQSRATDFRRGAPMRTFVVDELLPWIAERFRVTPDANARAIIGISAGARGALDAAAASTTFGRLGMLIPALDAEDIAAVPAAGARRLRVSILAGTYDALNLPAARAAQNMFTERGHDVNVVEVPEGHSSNTWRLHLRDVLVSLFGG